MNRIAVVLGTYNRLASLKRAVASVRVAAGDSPVTMVVVDGGSTDGTCEWLESQAGDVALLKQEGPLTGAVRAFNVGFEYAVKSGYGFVCHFNDDAEFLVPGMLQRAVEFMTWDKSIGEVAFEFDLYRDRLFDMIHGEIYANFGLVRREAGMAVAREQGDPSGCTWWNPIYHTYAADCEFACWMRRLGWRIAPGHGLRVHDMNVADDLRKRNSEINAERGDGKLFWKRWEHKETMMSSESPRPAD